MDRFRNRRVLIADDDPGIRCLLVAFLRRQGFRLLEAGNGAEALAKMRAGKADVVVMDLMMPRVSGWDVLRERAADPLLQWIPIVVVTANHSREVTADLLDQDVHAVLGKPFDLDVLLAAVTACLDQPNIPTQAAA
jgi:two-component system, NtrC family, response regulator AtoC